jgi:hypothetical protein
MSRFSGQDIYGLFEPRVGGDLNSIDKTPVRERLPHVLSEDELPLFEYPVIDPSSQIRLITLLPAERPPHGPDSREPIRCSISLYTLTQAPAYEALSYNWGAISRSLPVAIVTNNSSGEETEEALFTTPQLLSALRRLRLSTSRRLWIDQLSINQDNDAEKGPQIQMMGDVYKTALRVLIWLGEDMEYSWYEKDLTLTIEKDSQHVVDLVSAIRIENPGPDHEPTAIAAQMLDFGFTYHYENIGLRRMRAVREMLRRPWFRRAWVFQEAALAQNIVMVFGRSELSFEDLKFTLDAIQAAVTRVGMQNEAHCSLQIGTPGYEMMDIIQKTRMEAHGGGDASPDPSVSSKFLIKLLQVLRRVQCYSQQDLIFAFLAFQQQEGIVATDGAYEQAVEDTWRSAAERIIQTSSSLDIFAAASGRINTLAGMPSWVPNWGDCFPYSRPFAAPGSRFRACRGLVHKWNACTDRKKLIVKGKVIDHIKMMTQSFTQFRRDMQSVWLFLSWGVTLQWVSHSLYAEDIMKQLGDYFPIKQENAARDLARTLLADGTLGQEQPLRNVHRYVDAIVATYEQQDLLKPGRMPLESEKSLFADCDKVVKLALVAEEKKVFYTRHIQLGMTVESAEIGDCVAILHGSKTPCILRKVEGCQNEYILIGQCYLNGWMYGESPKELHFRDGKRQLHPQAKWWEEEPDEFVLV